MSQPIRSENDVLMSGCVPYLMQDITTPPEPVSLLFLYNQLGYIGPTIVKPVPFPGLDPWARVLEQLWIGTILLGGGVHLDSRGYTSTPGIRNSGKG